METSIILKKQLEQPYEQSVKKITDSNKNTSHIIKYSLVTLAIFSLITFTFLLGINVWVTLAIGCVGLVCYRFRKLNFDIDFSIDFDKDTEKEICEELFSRND